MGDVVTANRNDSGLNHDVAADGGQSAVGGRRGRESGIAGNENSRVKDH